MAGNKCIVCQKTVILEEGNLCTECELKDDYEIPQFTNNVNCGSCKFIVEEDSEGLVCDMCDSWYHNHCCVAPLKEDLYSLLNEAPNNVKWFCDKCIWETEKWIQCFKVTKTDGGVCDKEPEYDPSYYPKEPEIKIEIQNEGIPIEFNDSWSNYSDSEEERKKVKKKKKIGKKVHKCNQCEKAFACKSSLKKHIDNLNHHGTIPYQCKYCDESFTNKGALKEHMQTHPEYKEENENEDMSNDLDDRLSTNSGDNEETKRNKKKTRTGNTYECNRCGKEFSYKCSFKKHIDICDHNGAKTYQCKHCEECFSNKGDRRKHQKTHSKNKVLVCSHCGKVFRRQDHLRKHETIHTGEKPHQCGHCGRTFARRDHMVKHERIHTGEKPHECGYCGKVFARRDNFKTHERIHTGEKPYQCNHCEKGFINKSNLTQHLKTHTANKPFQRTSPTTPLPIFTKRKSTIPVSTPLPIFTKRKPTLPVSKAPMSGSTRDSQSVHNTPMPSTTLTPQLSRPIINSSSSTPLTSSNQMPIQMMSTQSLSYPPRTMPSLQNSTVSFPHTQPNIQHSSMSSPNDSSNLCNTHSSPPYSMEYPLSQVQSINTDSMHTSYMPFYSMPSTRIPTHMGAESYQLTVLDGRHESLK